MEQQQSPELALESVTRRFGTQTIFERLTTTVTKGERLALVGSNGAGKTTLLRCVAGSLTPDEGRILIAGSPAGSMKARRRVGVSLSQERSFYLRLTGEENLLFFSKLRGRSKRKAKQEVAALVEELELGSIVARRVDRCSSGMMQQISIARALLGDPTLVLLDEPTRSMDQEASGRLWGALDRRPDTTLLIATHHPEDVDRCTRKLEMHGSS